jgi:hypothetical protein
MATKTSREEYDAERAKVREQRVSLLKAYMGRLAYQVNLLPTQANPADERTETSPTYGDLTAGIRMCVDQLRLEYRALEPAGLADTPEESPKVEEHNPLKGLRIVG